MELRPPSSTATLAGGGSAKLRLMCSYGGHIVPRPGPNKSFCYVGGDTRIVSVDRRTVTTLDLLVSHLTATLSVDFSFTLKYQLPHLDLDSLISLTSDEDFQIFFDEFDRLCSTTPSAAPSRIRVFLFPVYSVPGSGRPVIRHPKTESWFFDALKSAKILQKGLGEAHGYGYCHGSGVEGHGFVSWGPDTMVLETSSSFESTSSSASLTNLLPLKSQSNEVDNEFVSQDSKAMLIQTNAVVPSDNYSFSNIEPQHQNVLYQDAIVHANSSIESSNNTNMEAGYNKNNTSFPYLNQQVQRQHGQFVPFQHMTYHQPNQPYPIYYLVPYAQPPPYSFNTTASSDANLNSTFITSQDYRRPTSSLTTLHGDKQQGEIYVPPMYVQSQNACCGRDDGNDNGGDELDNVLIYKSQPPPPSSSTNSQFKSVMKDMKLLAQDEDFK